MLFFNKKYFQKYFQSALQFQISLTYNALEMQVNWNYKLNE